MKRGEIYLLDLKEPRGFVQAGKRPVVVIQNDVANQYSNSVIVCAITSAPKKNLPTHLILFNNGGLKRLSCVLCEQILTVDRSELSHYIGAITDRRQLSRLNECIRTSLGLQEEYDDRSIRNTRRLQNHTRF